MTLIKSTILCTFFCITSLLTTAAGQITDYSTENFFYEVDIDINQITEPVQTTTGRQDLIFYSYYAVLNSERVNSRTFSGLSGLYSRKNLYTSLIDELAAQAELSPYYVLYDSNMGVLSSVRQKKDALLFTFPILGVSDELYPVLEGGMDPGIDVPINKGLSIVGEMLSEIDQASDLPYLKEAMKVLDDGGLALSRYRLLGDAEQMAVSFTLFMALDMELYRNRVKNIKMLSESRDPAFWYAVNEIEDRLDLVDRSFWIRTFQFAVENIDELLSLQYQPGMFEFNSIKTQFSASMSSFVPWIGASAFAHGQYKMAEQHRRSLAYGTLAGTLYKDLEAKDINLQSYLGYIYLRERNMAFQNWRTSVFNYLNFSSWSEVLNEFQRGYDDYRYSWLRVFLDQFFDEKIQIVEREKVISRCDEWSIANSINAERTIDIWDVSALQRGVMIDIRYSISNIPDKLTLEYPKDNVLLERGLLNNTTTTQEHNYETELSLFRKTHSDYFTIEVHGNNDVNEWEYQVRCREERKTRPEITHVWQLDQSKESDHEVLKPSAVAENQRENELDQATLRPESDPNITNETNSDNSGQQEEHEVIWVEENHEQEEVENTRPLPSGITRQNDYRTKQLLSIDYSNIVGTNSTLFRNENLVSASSGTSYSLTGYYLDGFRSGRGGIMYLRSSGTASEFTNSGFVEESFDYSHVSIYASYSPSFEIYDSRTTYLLGYIDVGGSAILASLTYNDYEEVIDGNFIDITNTEVLIDNEWFPGINIGAGIIYNYKYLGFHLGYMAEFTMIEELGTSFVNFFPQFGVNIRRR